MELAFFWPVGFLQQPVVGDQARLSAVRLLSAFFLTTIPENRRLREADTVAHSKGLTEALSAKEELTLKVTKEIVVKFIEVGRLSPASFPETFKMVIDTVRQSLEEEWPAAGGQ